MNNTVDALKNLYKTLTGQDYSGDPNPTDAEMIDAIAKDADIGGGGSGGCDDTIQFTTITIDLEHYSTGTGGVRKYDVTSHSWEELCDIMVYNGYLNDTIPIVIENEYEGYHTYQGLFYPADVTTDDNEITELTIGSSAAVFLNNNYYTNGLGVHFEPPLTEGGNPKATKVGSASKKKITVTSP